MPANENTHTPLVDDHRAKMAVPANSPPGLEQDGKGNPIPLEQLTKEDQKKAAGRATQENDLTTGHSRNGDGGDDNSKTS